MQSGRHEMLPAWKKVKWRTPFLERAAYAEGCGAVKRNRVSL
jgi:hypothetical protein